MGVAPVPVMPLHSVLLPAVGTISPVLFHQVIPVGTVFAAIPVVVVTVVPVVDADLDGLLSLGFGDNQRWCGNRSSQKKCTDVATYTHEVALPVRGIRMRNPGSYDCAPLA